MHLDVEPDDSLITKKLQREKLSRLSWETQAKLRKLPPLLFYSQIFLAASRDPWSFLPCSIVISNPSNARAGQARSDGIGQSADRLITRCRKYHTRRRDIQIEVSVQLVHDSLLLVLHKRLRFARKSRSIVSTSSLPLVQPTANAGS
jgi:hypothetical protein